MDLPKIVTVRGGGSTSQVRAHVDGRMRIAGTGLLFRKRNCSNERELPDVPMRRRCHGLRPAHQGRAAAKASEIITTAINIVAVLLVGAQVALARRAVKHSADAQQREWDRLRRQATIEASISTAESREEVKAFLPWNDRDPEVVAAFLEDIGDDHAGTGDLVAY